MNLITIVNNPYLKIENVSLNLINGNNNDIRIYGTVSLISKDFFNNLDLSPTVALDVINNEDTIVYCERIEPFNDIFMYNNIENSFTITIVNYSRFFELPVKEFKLYTILKKK